MSATALLLFLVGLFVLANAINLREVFKGETKFSWQGLPPPKTSGGGGGGSVRKP